MAPVGHHQPACPGDSPPLNPDPKAPAVCMAGPGLRLALFMALASLAAITARTHAIQLMLQVGMTARVRHAAMWQTAVSTKFARWHNRKNDVLTKE